MFIVVNGQTLKKQPSHTDRRILSAKFDFLMCFMHKRERYDHIRIFFILKVILVFHCRSLQMKETVKPSNQTAG